MQFDQENIVVKRCVAGMAFEQEGKNAAAMEQFQLAWAESTNDLEKFIAAHYVARHQTSVEDKLKWDEIALSFALKSDEGQLKGSYPSLYLNIAKCYEDMNDLEKAKQNYGLALSYADCLPDNSYGKMIKSGIENGFERLT